MTALETRYKLAPYELRLPKLIPRLLQLLQRLVRLSQLLPDRVHVALGSLNRLALLRQVVHNVIPNLFCLVRHAHRAFDYPGALFNFSFRLHQPFLDGPAATITPPTAPACASVTAWRQIQHSVFSIPTSSPRFLSFFH